MFNPILYWVAAISEGPVTFYGLLGAQAASWGSMQPVPARWLMRESLILCPWTTKGLPEDAVGVGERPTECLRDHLVAW